MKEYWVNVYELNHFVGIVKWTNNKCIPLKDYNFGKVIYRIHVKMKEFKPKYDYIEQPQHLFYSKHERLVKQIPAGKHWMDY